MPLRQRSERLLWFRSEREQARVAIDNPVDAAANPTDLVRVVDFANNSGPSMRTQCSRSAVVALAAEFDCIERTKTTQPVSEVIKELPTDQAVDGVVPEILVSDIDPILITQDKDDDHNKD
ncbi:uncharacterized protein TRUGW13939_00010 [Talaromyces rugulosus]|uniref:Uncharacterized protein n=1 Tax=Talaromyces rugulosus TaxID=121627 RepID=A0A7H8QGD6_TALRU|nr:uncharacterized protein TRUGW13939_00010 [Talaromyces rugulosus]QKX52939.1 hypothetical protein TRUGW13939_00010 [Talaromyces rugulosus]